MTKTATVSLHGNTYQVEAALVGRKVELVFSPFNLEHIEVRYRDSQLRPGGAAPHHPPRPPESPTGNTRTGAGAGHRDRLPATGRRHPPPAGRRRRDGSASTPSTPPTSTAPIGTDPTSNCPGSSASTTSSTSNDDASRRPGRGDGHDRSTPASALRVSPGCRSAGTSPRAMLHRHAGHGEAVARIAWCVDQHALGVITGEVGAGQDRRRPRRDRRPGHLPARGHLPAQPVRRGPRHAAPHRRRPRSGPELLHRDPRPAGRRRVGRRTRRTRPHPGRRHRRSAPAGQRSNWKRSGC